MCGWRCRAMELCHSISFSQKITVLRTLFKTRNKRDNNSMKLKKNQKNLNVSKQQENCVIRVGFFLVPLFWMFYMGMHGFIFLNNKKKPQINMGSSVLLLNHICYFKAFMQNFQNILEADYVRSKLMCRVSSSWCYGSLLILFSPTTILFWVVSEAFINTFNI